VSTQSAILETPIGYRDAELAAMAEQIEARAWRDIFAAAPQWLRSSAQLIAEDSNGALLLASRGIPHWLFNRVIGLGEQCIATDSHIDEIMDRYWNLGIAHYWVHVGPYAQPARLSRVLQQHGLKPYRRSWVKMMRPARRVSLARSEVTVRRAHLDDAYQIASILGSAFDLPQRGAELLSHLIDRLRWTLFVAELENQIVAAAGLFMDGNVAYLAFAATREAYQRRGAQRALMQARINFACDAGYPWIATETAFPLAADEPSPSYHNMLWAGFRPVSIRDNYAPLGTEWKQTAR
jgi:GNAT superfamily N-acetyltransferase